MIYTVKSGDTLGVIASRHKTTIEALMRLNQEITDKDLIFVGQQIRITTQALAARTHKIVKRDTLWALAKKYGTTVADLERLNPGIEARNLRTGQEIVISMGESIDIVKFFTDLGWRVTSPYGMRLHPIKKVMAMHHGIDLAGRPCGHPVYSPVDGLVVRAQAYSGYGNTVVIECARGLWHILAHAQELRVKMGMRVEAGKTVLSLNGTTGDSTGCHVHYQINPKGSIKGADAVMDPRDY